MIEKVFISGMGRSGTTLLDKLLATHKDIDIISQPFPLLYVKIKKKFLDTIGKQSYYVLNDEPSEVDYSLSQFETFLDNCNFSKNELMKLFTIMKNYDGQYTKIKDKNLEFKATRLNSFIEIFNKAISLFDFKSGIKFVGVKETFCEEFMPYMCSKGFKCIIILRDPRDVLASANYPSGKKYLGNKKPTLFLLRTWRKSVEYINILKNNENFYFLKYEDLVRNPYSELNKICSFLEIIDFRKNIFNEKIYNRDGKLWSANSSHDNSNSFISNKSIGAYKSSLSKNEITYVESICKKEMLEFNYTFDTNNLNAIDAITNFKDFDILDQNDLPANYSSLEENIEREIIRSKIL